MRDRYFRKQLWPLDKGPPKRPDRAYKSYSDSFKPP